MKKFEVNFEKTYHLIVDVEAENEEQAKEKARMFFNDRTKEELLEKSQEGYFEHTYTDEVKTELTEDIETIVENIFYDIVKKYELKSGDITPTQVLRVDDFKALLKEFIEQNNEAENEN